MGKRYDVRKHNPMAFNTRAYVKSITTLVDNEGHEHNVTFADALASEFNEIVLFYDCGPKPTKVLALDTYRREVGPYVNIINDKVFNAHNQAIRELELKIRNNGR